MQLEVIQSFLNAPSHSRVSRDNDFFHAFVKESRVTDFNIKMCKTGTIETILSHPEKKVKILDRYRDNLKLASKLFSPTVFF